MNCQQPVIIQCGFCVLLSEHHKEQKTLEQPVSGRQCADGEEMAWSKHLFSSYISVKWLPFHRRHTVCVCVCVPQPKLTDEEGWKRFCLGEMVFLGLSSCSAEPEPALDYSKVVWMCICVTKTFQFIFFFFLFFLKNCEEYGVVWKSKRPVVMIVTSSVTACVCTQVGFPPFLSIVSRLNQVNPLLSELTLNQFNSLTDVCVSSSPLYSPQCWWCWTF